MNHQFSRLKSSILKREYQPERTDNEATRCGHNGLYIRLTFYTHIEWKVQQRGPVENENVHVHVHDDDRLYHQCGDAHVNENFHLEE